MGSHVAAGLFEYRGERVRLLARTFDPCLVEAIRTGLIREREEALERLRNLDEHVDSRLTQPSEATADVG